MKSTLAGITIPLILLGLSSLLGCTPHSPQTDYVKDGRRFGVVRGAFRHRWWNYYERGLSYKEGEFYPEAIADFGFAIAQREDDQRMARAYGMHFIDYFPHRELGIAYFETGNLDKANAELERSLSHWPTAKTRFYLDRVRRALILQKGVEVPPPVIDLEEKSDEIWSRADSLVLTGVVRDDNYVAGVRVRGVKLFQEGSEKQLKFQERLPLAQGDHTIDIRAENLAGSVAKKTIDIHVDRQGPLITLEKIDLREEEGKQSVAIKGFLYDSAGVSSFAIEDEAIAIEEGTEVFFSRVIKSTKDDVTLVARDILGNETKARISLIRSPAKTQRPVYLASRESSIPGYLAIRLFGSQDKIPPDIKLKGLTDTQTVYLEKIVIEGQVADQSGVVDLNINNLPVLSRRGGFIVVAFNQLLELTEGKNIINITAQDEAGNLSTKVIEVVREIPSALKIEYRMSISVMPFEKKGAISHTSLSFQDNLIDALVDRKRFRVVERSVLETILQEHKLSQTALVDRSTALRIGKLSAAHSIITGSIVESRAGIEIIARVIDVETSEILDTEDGYIESKDLTLLNDLAERLAVKIHREFPLINGIVVQKKGSYIFTDIGADKIGSVNHLIVYREHAVVHPQTGIVLGNDAEIVSRAYVKQISPKMTKAELIDHQGRDVNPLDKVITE